MFQTIAIHDVVPEHADAFLAFMRRVEVAVADAPGLIEFTSHRDVQTGRLVGYARWESAEAFQAALPTVMGLSGERRTEWTSSEDQLLALAPA